MLCVRVCETIRAWTAVLAMASAAFACLLYDTGTGEQVRARLFGEDFGRTLIAVLLPFPILLAAVAMAPFGCPVRTRRSSQPKPRLDIRREGQR